MKITKADSLLLIIDIQEKLFPFIFKNKELSERTMKLINGCKVLGLNIFYTEQYPKGLGQTISPIKDLLEGITPKEKSKFTCCGADGIDDYLKRAGKKFIIIAGIEAHVCVLQTVIDLCQEGYIPVIVEDCVSSRAQNDKEIALVRMKQEGAIITTFESILFELLGDSKAPEFKSISKIVK
jgi:nicotinamidase-related amidase